MNSKEVVNFPVSEGGLIIKKRALVLGGGGFIGGHLVKRLLNEGWWVRSVDLRPHQYGVIPSEFFQGDLTDFDFCLRSFTLEDNVVFDRVYQLAADMGGAGYIFTGDNDANVMRNSSLINLNVLSSAIQIKGRTGINKTIYFYSSSACVYPEEKQLDTDNPGLKESDAYPANPDSEYGWEKIFSERLFLAFSRNYELQVRIARFHNIFGPEGTWKGGREKAPAAICRKVIEGQSSGVIEIWGDGNQTRSFLFIDNCLNAIESLMKSDHSIPLNIGSERMISIRELVDLISSFGETKLRVVCRPGPQGVRGRKSNNDEFRRVLGWDLQDDLEKGLEITYNWIKGQVQRNNI